MIQHTDASKRTKISPTTADQYVSHVVKWLRDHGCIESSTQVRSELSRDVIKGLVNLHPSTGIPRRLRCKIPCTYHIFAAALQFAASMAGSDVRLALASRAALALGYALSLRPSEYLCTSPRGPWRGAHSSLAFFWFPDDPFPYSVCDPAAFPPGATPTEFTLFLDFNKNHQAGDSGPRSMASAPPSSPFCCVRLLFDYVTQFPPSPHSPLLSGGGPHITVAHIRSIFAATARSLGLDPARLVCHSLRSAAVSQMLALPHYSDMDFRATGQWQSIAGIAPYAHTSLAHARRVAHALYDPAAHPLAATRLHYSATSSSPTLLPHPTL